MTQTPIDIMEDRLSANGNNPKRKGTTLTAQCPAHDDRSPSLSVGEGLTRDIVVHCHAGCRPDDIMAALDIAWTDLSDASTAEPERTYDYTDADGKLVYQVVRKAGKKFLQRRPDGAGGWEWNLRGVEPTIYNLPTVRRAIDNGHPIWICEGEKDADRLNAEGVIATCNSGGAGKFTPALGQHLNGAPHVNIIADRDEPGIAHATDVANILDTIGAPYTILQAAKGKDVSDHFAFGLGLGDLVNHNEVDDPTSEEWPEPSAIHENERPPFPIDMLPDWIANHVEQVAVEMQLTSDLAGQLAITALSVVASKRATINIRGPWTEGLNTYLVTAMPPSAGKSPTFSMMLGALDRWEEELTEDTEKLTDDRELDRKHLEKQRDDALRKGEVTESKAHADALREMPPIHPPRLLADDATPEKLTELLHEQRGRLALVSTEGGLFGMMTGRYSDKSNLDVYLGAWSGDTIRVDRVERGSLVVRNPRLSIGLTVQPDVVASIGKNKELVGRGLTARFMYVIPADTVGTRSKSRESTYDDSTEQKYALKLLDIAHALPPIGADERRLGFSNEAARLFTAWQDEREQQLTPHGPMRYMAEWIAKCDSTTARLAGLLHIADDNHDDVVSEQTVRRAIVVGNYWTEHAKSAFDLMSASVDTTLARRILGWLQTKPRPAVMSFRDITHSGSIKRHVDSTAELVPAVDILIESGYLRPRFEGSLTGHVGRGSGKSPEFDLHPSLTPLDPTDPTSTQGVTESHGKRLSGVSGVSAPITPPESTFILPENVEASSAPKRGALTPLAEMADVNAPLATPVAPNVLADPDDDIGLF